MARNSSCPHCQADLSEVPPRGNLCPRCLLELPGAVARPSEASGTDQSCLARITVGKADRATEIGIELLNLCQTITEDGRVLEDEIRGLHQWLETNGHVEMPAISALRKCVSAILADGIVNDAERNELQKVIERILPPDLRRYAVLKRREASAEEKLAAVLKREELKLQKQRTREQEKAQQERNRPVEAFDFMVAGVAYEGRGCAVSTHAHEGMPAYLVRDRANQYSRNAVEVRLGNGIHIGYVPEETAVELAPLLDANCKARASIKRLLTKTRTGYPIPIISGELYRPDASVPSAVFESEVPSKRHPRADAGTGCGGCMILIVASVLILVFKIIVN